MASAELSRRVEKVVGYPPLSEMDERHRRSCFARNASSYAPAYSASNLAGRIISDPRPRSTYRVMLAVAMLVAVTALLGELPSGLTAHANGGPAFSLRNFDYSRTARLEPDGAGGQMLVDVNHWRVTICTPRPARLRIRAIVESFDFGTQRFRFVRRQPAGCARHRLRAVNDVFPEQATDSRLRVAWRNQRRRTSRLTAAHPAPD